MMNLNFVTVFDSNDTMGNGTHIKILNNPDGIHFVENGISKIFRQRPGSNVVEITPYAQYILAAQAKADFSRYVVKLDGGCKYHAENEVEIPDPDYFKEEKSRNEDAYAKYLTEYHRERDAHPDWFLDQEQVENIAPYISRFIHGDVKKYQPENLEACVDAYKISNAALKRIKGDTSSIPKTVKKVISPEHKEEWSKITEKIKKDVGYITDSEIKNNLIKSGKIKKDVSTRLKMSRQPGTNSSQLNIYLENLLESLMHYEVERIFG